MGGVDEEGERPALTGTLTQEVMNESQILPPEGSCDLDLSSSLHKLFLSPEPELTLNNKKLLRAFSRARESEDIRHDPSLCSSMELSEATLPSASPALCRYPANFLYAAKSK